MCSKERKPEMTYFCTESCYYNNCGVCTKGNCPRFDTEDDEDTEDNEA